MANFIDIKHEAFIRGEKPYILWFDEQVSTGIYGSQSLLLYGLDSAHVELPSDQDIFRLYSEVPLEDLEEDSVNNHLTCSMDYVSDSNKVIQIIITCKSDTEADYLEDFTINGEEHTIGVQIRGENEILEINLANMGIELPKSIARAIYDGSLENISNTDFVLLNSKYLELLQNYANTIMNKGSYKSLMNSLKWFGYKDLAVLREVWKHTTEDGIKFGDFDISPQLSNDFKKALSVYSKTTYMVISCLVPKYLYDGDYALNLIDDLEDSNKGLPIDLLEISKYGKHDMRSKMYLLGVYFEKFFCPIHLDIIRSCVEDTWYGSLKINFGVYSETV